MSIIYADTCKACCHINNCIAKTVTGKKSTHGEMWATLSVEWLSPDWILRTVITLIAHHETLNLGSMPSTSSLFELLYVDSLVMNSWWGEKVRHSISDALIEVCCIDSTVYSSSSCAPLFMEHLASLSSCLSLFYQNYCHASVWSQITTIFTV